MSDRGKARAFLRRHIKHDVGIKYGGSSKTLEKVLGRTINQALKDAHHPKDRKLLADDKAPDFMTAAYM